MNVLRIPELSLVVLAGPRGAGKTTFARAHFRPEEALPADLPNLHEGVADRLRSAHVDRGRGYAITWPNGMFPLPPIRIDHALLSPEVECLAISEGIGTGSDHRPLVVDLRVHGQAGEPGTQSPP